VCNVYSNWNIQEPRRKTSSYEVKYWKYCPLYVRALKGPDSGSFWHVKLIFQSCEVNCYCVVDSACLHWFLNSHVWNFCMKSLLQISCGTNNSCTEDFLADSHTLFPAFSRKANSNEHQWRRCSLPGLSRKTGLTNRLLLISFSIDYSVKMDDRTPLIFLT